MNSLRIGLTTVLLATPFVGVAMEKISDVVTTVNGMEHPILIYLPEYGNGPFPVVFNVHGGGWNGGTETEMPGAGITSDSSYLCDEFGIIYVGLAYRCKNQNGTFALAMEDLHASVDWFRERAEIFNADLSRIGFSGGSAGTTLSAMMAQQVEGCKTYIGFWGVYDLMDNKASLFPDETCRGRYGLSTPEQALAASAFHHLRTPPPATLLIHGEKDILTHHSQSVKFAQQIQEKGGSAEVLLFPELNHGLVNPNNPVAFKKATLKIAEFYKKEFGLKLADINYLEKRLDEGLERYFPVDIIQDGQLVGEWKGRTASLRLLESGTAELLNRKGRLMKTGTFQNKGNSFEIVLDGDARTFYLRKDQRVIFEISNTERHTGRKEIYAKQK